MKILPAELLHPKPYRRRLVIAASILALSGCVSSVGNELETSQTTLPAAQSAAQSALPSDDGETIAQKDPSQNGAYRDPAVVTAAGQSPPGASGAPTSPLGNASADMTGLTMQPTGVNANRASIFASPGTSAVAAATAPAAPTGSGDDGQDMPAPAYVPVPEFNPAVKSMFSSNGGAVAAPQEGALGAPSRTLSQQAAALAAAEAPPSPETTQTIVPNAQTKPNGESTGKPETLTLAAFFAGKRKSRDKLTDSAAAEASGDTPGAITVNAGAMPQQAMISGSDLGDLMPDSFLDDDEFDDGHAEAPEGLMKLASLPGMTRTAPNGLVLQTPNVEVSCIRPELIRMIKSVEAHYGRSAIVTSGYRPAKHNRQIGGRRGSLHTTCAAADIQIPGVTKWELASYLRSRPDRGGVGTYCHTESVHLDIGEARDWNWRCRRRN